MSLSDTVQEVAAEARRDAAEALGKRTIREVRFMGNRTTVILSDGSELCGLESVEAESTFGGPTIVRLRGVVCAIQEKP